METYGPQAERLSKWAAVKAAARVTPKASRVAAFIVMWAAAMMDGDADALSISEYERYWHEGERQTIDCRMSSGSSGRSMRRRTNSPGL